MTPDIAGPLLPYDLSICGLDELDDFCSAGVTHVVSILDPEWTDPEVFDRFTLQRRTLLRFDDIVTPREGMAHPERAHIIELLQTGAALAESPVEHLLIHCHAGISRSTAAAAILMAQFNPGREAECFARIREVRPRNWPNSLMIRIADELLGRNGALVAALRGHYREMVDLAPDLAELIRRGIRAHEIPANA